MKNNTTLLIKPHDYLSREEAPNKIQHCFWMKNPTTNLEIEANFLNVKKGHKDLISYIVVKD